MVYKKYIEKNGKLYGPYIYHSKRVDGKVVSEYHGTKKSGFNFAWIFLGIFVLIVLVYFLIFVNKGITGNVVFSMDANYQKGEILDGKLDLVLNEGELIPSSSKIFFENSGEAYEFVLSDVLFDESVEGDFYLEGMDFSESGSGYGIEGVKTEYPEVYFILEVYSEQSSEQENSGGGSSGSEIENSEETQVENEIVEEVVEETSEEIESEEVIEEESVEEPEEIIENYGEEASEEVIEEVVQEETNNAEEQTVEENSEPIAESTSEEQNTEPETQETTAPITGGVISRIFKFTGKVTMEFENEISGKVSAGEEFVYELQDGQKAELKPKSVKTDSGELGDNFVSVKTQGNKVIVTTDYSEKQKGFGKDYLGDSKKTISIDLNKLNLNLEEGELITRLVYEGKEIISLSTFLEEGEISNEIVLEENETVEEMNETMEEFNLTINESSEEILEDFGDFLTESERQILVEEFGNISVKTVNANLIKDRIVVEYKIGNYVIEYSYDSDLSDEVLELQMEEDRIKWLKDIAKSLSESEISSEKLEKFEKDHNM